MSNFNNLNSGQALRGSGMGATLDYGTSSLLESKLAQCNQNQATQRPASELAADIHNMIAAQERALRTVMEISAKLFGPEPVGNDKGEIGADYLSALISRSRRLADEIANRLEGINSNI